MQVKVMKLRAEWRSPGTGDFLMATGRLQVHRRLIFKRRGVCLGLTEAVVSSGVGRI